MDELLGRGCPPILRHDWCRGLWHAARVLDRPPSSVTFRGRGQNATQTGNFVNCIESVVAVGCAHTKEDQRRSLTKFQQSAESGDILGIVVHVFLKRQT